MFDVYITKSAKFLPNEPVSNDEIEERLGLINEKASKTRRIILRNNKIETRHYAIDKQGNKTHTNAELTNLAINNLFDEHFTKKEVELISCGSSTPDLILPSLAAMVHGLFKEKNVEINSAAGCCNAGMNALKYGFMSVMSGNTNNAVCTGSERTSSWMQANKFEAEVDALEKLNETPVIGFNKDFLRWMLSDGAGAFLLENNPKGSLPLKIEWMDSYSYAHELETCMYAGGDKMENGDILPWSDYQTNEWVEKSIFAIKQDVKLLDTNILVKGAESFKAALEKHQVLSSEIDYFLPHVSSYYFVDGLAKEMELIGVPVPKEKWFMNLNKVGNVGAASIYVALDELINSGKLKKGDKIMLSVPESGRFSYTYAYLTVC